MVGGRVLKQFKGLLTPSKKRIKTMQLILPVISVSPECRFVVEEGVKVEMSTRKVVNVLRVLIEKKITNGVNKCLSTSFTDHVVVDLILQ